MSRPVTTRRPVRRDPQADVPAATRTASTSPTPLQEGSTRGVSPEGGSVKRGGSNVSVVGDGPPFASLIQAREEQQRRLRARLEEQNLELQHRLSQSDGKVPAQEFITFVAELKEMVTRHHETENSTLRALHEMICMENNELRGRMEALESRLEASEEARSIVRDDQTEQSIAVSIQVDALKEDVERLIELTADHERKIEANPATSGKLDEHLADLDDRLGLLEDVPSEIRREMVDIGVQLEELRQEVAEEMRALKERYPDTEQKLTAVMTKAEDNLSILQNQADAAVATANFQAQHVEELVESGIAELGNGLRSLLERRADELSVKVAAELESLGRRAGDADLKLEDTLEEMRHSVEEYISVLEDENKQAIEEALVALKQQAAQQDSDRRKEYPTAAPERVALMVRQLESAYLVLEGVARNAATHTVALDHPYIRRLEAVEVGLSKVLNDGEISLLPKMCFSVDTQTAIAERLDSTHQRQQGAFEEEVQIAASEAAIYNVNAAVEYALEKARSQPTPSHIVTSNKQRSPSVPEAVVEVEIRKKQQAVEKIQNVLKDIAKKFQELSDREPQGPHLTEEDRRAIDLISRQKSAIYQKERELLEKRNDLLRSLKQLTSA